MKINLRIKNNIRTHNPTGRNTIRIIKINTRIMNNIRPPIALEGMRKEFAACLDRLMSHAAACDATQPSKKAHNR